MIFRFSEAFRYKHFCCFLQNYFRVVFKIFTENAIQNFALSLVDFLQCLPIIRCRKFFNLTFQ